MLRLPSQILVQQKHRFAIGVSIQPSSDGHISEPSHIVGRNPHTGEIGIEWAFPPGGPWAYSPSARIPADELTDYYDEMAGTLAEAGVDLFLVEPTGRDNEARVIESRAAKATGLPVWVGFDAHVSSDETMVLGSRRRQSGPPPAGARMINENMTLAESIAEVAPVRPDVMAVFHSRITDLTAGLQVMLNEWSGPVLAYPDAGRMDYVQTWRDRTATNEESPAQFTEAAQKWVDMGVQVVGACCGFGADYIKPLKEALPDKIARPRKA